jgi:hypothetical protein
MRDPADFPLETCARCGEPVDVPAGDWDNGWDWCNVCNWEMAAFARQHLPAALDALEAAERRVAELEEMLTAEWKANNPTIPCPDWSTVARSIKAAKETSVQTSCNETARPDHEYWYPPTLRMR